MHKPVTTYETNKKKEVITTINYIGAYNDERAKLTGSEMVTTIGDMMA